MFVVGLLQAIFVFNRVVKITWSSHLLMDVNDSSFGKSGALFSTPGRLDALLVHWRRLEGLDIAVRSKIESPWRLFPLKFWTNSRLEKQHEKNAFRATTISKSTRLWPPTLACSSTRSTTYISLVFRSNWPVFRCFAGRGRSRHCTLVHLFRCCFVLAGGCQLKSRAAMASTSKINIKGL